MTQDDVAFRLRERGVSASAQQIRRWERGSHAPRSAVVPALADALGIAMDELYGEDDEEEDSAVMFDRAAQALALYGEYRLAADLKRQAVRARDTAKEPV